MLQSSMGLDAAIKGGAGSYKSKVAAIKGETVIEGGIHIAVRAGRTVRSAKSCATMALTVSATITVVSRQRCG